MFCIRNNNVHFLVDLLSTKKNSIFYYLKKVRIFVAHERFILCSYVDVIMINSYAKHNKIKYHTLGSSKSNMRGS